MTFTAATIKTAFAVLLLSGAAYAEGKPATQYRCWDGSIVYDPAKCPTMTPAEHKTWAESNATATGGNSTSNATGGRSTSTAHGGKGGNAVASGGSSKATGGNARQSQGQRQTASGGSVRGSGNSNVRIDNRTRQAAASAAAVTLPSNLTANCFGDVGPSGSFGASIQFFGGGAAATASKASNVCAAYAIGGPELALRYLQRADNSMPNPFTMELRSAPYCADPSHPNLRNGRCYK